MFTCATTAKLGAPRIAAVEARCACVPTAATAGRVQQEADVDVWYRPHEKRQPFGYAEPVCMLPLHLLRLTFC